MREKRKKKNELKIRLTDDLHDRLMKMANRRGIPASSLATSYVSKMLEIDHAASSFGAVDTTGGDSSRKENDQTGSSKAESSISRKARNG